MISIFIIILLISITLIFILWKKLKDKENFVNKIIDENKQLEELKKGELKKYFQEEWKQEKEKIEFERRIFETNISNKKEALENQYKLDASKYTAQIDNLKVQLTEKEKRYEEVNQDLDLYKQGKIREIDCMTTEYEQRKRQLIDHVIEEHKLSLQEQSGQLQLQLKEQEEKLKEEIEAIKKELEVERSKRAAINEEIRRAREVEEQQDFYRIQIDPNDINDVEVLRSIAPRLRHPEAINKIIWSSYYQKPLAELRKRVAIEGSGVYKITRIKTGEIYIGQAVNVSTRWAEHCKAALGVGTLTSTQLHRIMAQDGPENFLFELLEEVPRDSLRERESYYIDFYDSKNYGLNTLSGDKK